jgi:hypothetical protein
VPARASQPFEAIADRLADILGSRKGVYTRTQVWYFHVRCVCIARTTHTHPDATGNRNAHVHSLQASELHGPGVADARVKEN